MTQCLVLDGYNLIGTLGRYATRSTGSLDASRELLINDALKAAGWVGKEIIVVFDAAQSPEPGRTEIKAGGAVRVAYTSPKESADDFIERLVKSLNGSITVYTADFALQLTVLAHGATRSTPREFEELVDELPAFARIPNTPFRARVSNQLSSETLQSLEELRRRVGGR